MRMADGSCGRFRRCRADRDVDRDIGGSGAEAHQVGDRICPTNASRSADRAAVPDRHHDPLDAVDHHALAALRATRAGSWPRYVIGDFSQSNNRLGPPSRHPSLLTKRIGPLATNSLICFKGSEVRSSLTNATASCSCQAPAASFDRLLTPILMVRSIDRNPFLLDRLLA